MTKETHVLENPRKSIEGLRVRCPFCNFEDSKVTDSRNVIESNAVRRRRECLQCNRRFTTFEMVEMVMQIKKRDGRFEDFQRDKLFHGIELACRHTNISREGVQKLTDDLCSQFFDQAIREITTLEIGKLVMQKLQELDSIAYIRFACVYRRFRHVGELQEELQEVLERTSPHLKEEICP